MGASNGKKHPITLEKEKSKNLNKPVNLCENLTKPVNLCENLTKPVDLQKAIVSKYIIADIFGLLGKDKKLKVITYSTKMKKILGICLDDYKKRSLKVFVGERNGIGKEYKKDTNIIVFEGQYLKGKKKWKRKRIL